MSSDRWRLFSGACLRALLYALAIAGLVLFAQPGAEIGIYAGF